MNVKAIICGLLATTAFGAGAVTVAASNDSPRFEATSAAAPTNTRRVWVIDNNGTDSNTKWWNDSGKVMYAHVWTSSGSTDVTISTNVLSDYYKGLWYFDVTLSGATTELNVIIRVGDSNGAYGWGNNNQTFTQTLGEFGSADTIWLNNGVTWDGGENRNSRNASIGTTNGFSGAQLASVLSHYHTCSSTNTDGYNSYPQMETNFFKKTDQSAFSTKVYGQNTYTCQDYVDGMYARYNANK